MTSEINQIKYSKIVQVCLAALALFLVLLSIAEIKQIFTHAPAQPAADTIVVNGTGDVVAVPDIATFSFEVTETDADIGTAQTMATTKTDAAIKAMTDAGVASSDIQTLAYNIDPNYEYSGGVCGLDGVCTPSKSTITGYDVSETVQVKVRDLTKAGSLLQTIGSLGVQNVDSLQFSIDKPEVLQDQARTMAITDAKAKAASLAGELGVRLVRIVGFSEDSGGGSPVPIMYAAAMTGATGDAAAAAPTISTGQQKVTSDVSITYQIR